jgi:hypothetical protein
MKTLDQYTHLRRLSALGVSALAITCLAGVAIAQDDGPDLPIRAMFLRSTSPIPLAGQPAGSLPLWNGSFVYSGTTYNYEMVGAAPSTNSATVIPAVIIPIKIKLSKLRGGATYDPSTIPSNTGGLTAIQNVVESPIFDSTTTYTQGGVDVGTTQYEDAYQRANFWGIVSSNPNYHVTLSPTVMSEVTLDVPFADGKSGSAFGETVGMVSYSWIDGKIQSLITSLGITPGTLPIFMVYQTYLTESGTRGCCIGGYHNAVGSQTYSVFSYAPLAGAFSQDVSALSHELGEWMDDPGIGGFNACPCGGILEVGDPLEGNTNYGGYPYVLHGFTYNLQDLVTLPYFGAPPSTSVNNQFTFQGESLTVCQNGQ